MLEEDVDGAARLAAALAEVHSFLKLAASRAEAAHQGVDEVLDEAVREIVDGIHQLCDRVQTIRDTVESDQA